MVLGLICRKTHRIHYGKLLLTRSLLSKDYKAGPSKILFLDDSAGQSGASVPGRVRLIVVRHGMDHQSGSTLVEKRVLTVRQCDPGRCNVGFSVALSIYLEVWKIAGMGTHGVVLAMLLHGRIKMAPGRHKVGALTTPCGVNVKR